MPDENSPSGAQGGESQLNSAPAPENVGSVAQAGLTVAEINSLLGKNYLDIDSARKGLKETNSFVGKRREDIEAEVMSKLANEGKTDQLAKELEEMRKERFFDKNPQYADPSIRAIIEATGKNPAEAVELPAFKDVFSKVKGYEETQSLKTVLESNPRLASSRDSLTKAAELSRSKEGFMVEPTGQAKEDRDALVVSAVRDAFGF